MKKMPLFCPNHPSSGEEGFFSIRFLLEPNNERVLKISGPTCVGVKDAQKPDARRGRPITHAVYLIIVMMISSETSLALCKLNLSLY
jgi:hypothetical protein